MSIIKRNESFPERPVIILLYGMPGVGKTSLFNTSENPILLDCDRGADRSIYRQDTIVAAKWQEVLKDEPSIKEYKTLGIDTAKSVLDDFLMTYVCEQDYKLRTNKLKAYGAIADEFKAFINRRRAEGIDIVIIAHAKEDKDGDTTKFSPDVTGGSKDLLMRIADQVGFITTSNNQRTIYFDPSDRTIGKNVARLPALQIPDEGDPRFSTFMASIISQVKKSIHARNEAQLQAQNKTDELKAAIEALVDAEGADAIFAAMKVLPKATAAGLKPTFKAKCDQMGIVYNSDINKFEKCTASA